MKKRRRKPGNSYPTRRDWIDKAHDDWNDAWAQAMEEVETLASLYKSRNSGRIA